MFNIKVLLNFFDLNFIKKNMLIMLFFALIPFGEILFLLYIGETLGQYLVFAIAAATGLIGFFFSYDVVQRIIRRIKAKIKKDKYPEQEFLGLAGAILGSSLLITPGFATDIIGLLIFIPGFRRAAGQIIVRVLEIQLKELYEYLKLYDV